MVRCAVPVLGRLRMTHYYLLMGALIEGKARGALRVRNVLTVQAQDPCAHASGWRGVNFVPAYRQPIRAAGVRMDVRHGPPPRPSNPHSHVAETLRRGMTDDSLVVAVDTIWRASALWSDALSRRNAL